VANGRPARCNYPSGLHAASYIDAIDAIGELVSSRSRSEGFAGTETVLA
jgi:hypothetical protein